MFTQKLINADLNFHTVKSTQLIMFRKNTPDLELWACVWMGPLSGDEALVITYFLLLVLYLNLHKAQSSCQWKTAGCIS